MRAARRRARAHRMPCRAKPESVPDGPRGPRKGSSRGAAGPLRTGEGGSVEAVEHRLNTCQRAGSCKMGGQT